MPIRIVLADPHSSYRRVVSELIDSAEDMVVAGEARDGHDALLVTALARPDLVILEMAMPRVDGLQACRRIRAANNRVQVLALTLHNDSCYVQGMLAAGALGYVLKQDAFAHLLAAVREVAQGRPYLSPSLSGEFVHGALPVTSLPVSS